MPDVEIALEICGPFDIPYESQANGTSKRIGLEQVQVFWDAPGVKTIASQQGCYVFALAASRGYVPWYVGKATKTFEQEVFHSHKLVYYNDVIFKGRKGKPVMFCVARAGSRTKIPAKQIDEVETFLIQAAKFKNPELSNKQKAAMPKWGIRGVVRGGSGKAPANATKFKKMMGL
jgi:hypothetical protein